VTIDISIAPAIHRRDYGDVMNDLPFEAILAAFQGADPDRLEQGASRISEYEIKGVRFLYQVMKK
jgi:hypothetical protein